MPPYVAEAAALYLAGMCDFSSMGRGVQAALLCVQLLTSRLFLPPQAARAPADR